MFRQLLEVRKAGKSNINDWSWHAWNLALACTPAGLLWVGLEQVREEIEELEKDTKMDKIRPAEVVTEMQERETRIADQNRSGLGFPRFCSCSNDLVGAVSYTHLTLPTKRIV
eukprot:TRINITY_DN14430_c0_g1_i2.p1 TRINITY_DN14430_c0_g1~~TRINITY_DN14430_c0_g1_i2.p1  ORF type:complete len:113 (+),score=21.93 TRINITY_DN14430_c0_g1_i2:81-419(+)